MCLCEGWWCIHVYAPVCRMVVYTCIYSCVQDGGVYMYTHLCEGWWCIHVYAPVCRMVVYVCICAYVQVHFLPVHVMLDVFPETPHLLHTVSHWTWNLVFQLDWLVSPQNLPISVSQFSGSESCSNARDLKSAGPYDYTDRIHSLSLRIYLWLWFYFSDMGFQAPYSAFCMFKTIWWISPKDNLTVYIELLDNNPI